MVVVTDTVPLARHLVLSNNVRGLAVYHPDIPPEREVFTWLSRKHQYRNVGVPPSLIGHPTVDLTSYKTFTTLEYPVASLETLHSLTSETHPTWVTESIILASAYVTPLFIHQSALDAFSEFSVWQLTVDTSLPEDQVLRHMRIADYGMLDFFEESTANAWHALQENKLTEERERREEKAEADGQERFWRLIDGAKHARDQWVGGYFDILPALPETNTDVPEAGQNAAIGLGLVGGFAISPPYED